MASGLITVPAGFLGLPSLHSIIQTIAGGFFGALAGALVPSWLKHGTVATIQQLVALPDPADWAHVGALQSEMTYLGAMLAPVTLAVGALRYWAMGLTGSAHPVSAVTRCAGATAALVGYRWCVEQVVAATNTLTHGVLGLPSVSGGLARIIGVLFGGALLSGAGGVFGAFLVIFGVLLAAGLFAAQVLLTVALALLVVAGPPLIALAAIPELAHLARIWRDALLAVALIPLGWTVLFATAGALCLDATSFTGGAGGLPGHVAAAFAGLITFFLAVRLPFVLLGGLRGRLAHGGGQAHSTAGGVIPGDPVKSSRARLRSIGLEAMPALGASVGRAAGALGAPVGGPIGAARRTFRNIRSDAGMTVSEDGTSRAKVPGEQRRAVRERFREAGAILARAPGEAMRRTPGASSYQRGGLASTRQQTADRTRAGRTPRGAARPERSMAPRQTARPGPDGGAGRAAPPRAPTPSVSATHRPGARNPTARSTPTSARPPARSAPTPAGPPAPPIHPEMHAVPSPGEHPRPAPRSDDRRPVERTTRPAPQVPDRHRDTTKPPQVRRPKPAAAKTARRQRKPRG